MTILETSVLAFAQEKDEHLTTIFNRALRACRQKWLGNQNLKPLQFRELAEEKIKEESVSKGEKMPKKPSAFVHQNSPVWRAFSHSSTRLHRKPWSKRVKESRAGGKSTSEIEAA
jgi:hypothetical protein